MMVVLLVVLCNPAGVQVGWLEGARIRPRRGGREGLRGVVSIRPRGWRGWEGLGGERDWGVGGWVGGIPRSENEEKCSSSFNWK